MRFRFFFIFICITLNAQNQKTGVVLDKESNLPIEFVDIYNKYDNTITNEDGKFFFFSSGDSISFSKLGFKKIKTLISKVSDTILLSKKAIELEGITLTQTDSLWQKVKRNIASNYSLLPYNEKFFLRGTLRLNDTLVRIQDMQGLLRRKTLIYANDLELTTKDYEIDLINMRKTGVITSKNEVYFRFPTFYGLLSSFARLNATGPGFKLTEKSFLNESKTRYEFEHKSKSGSITGHYIINTINYAIEEFYLLQKVNLKNNFIPFSKNKWLRYKTNLHEIKVLFDLNLPNDKYFIKNATFKQQVECTDEERSFTDTYECRFILNTYDNFSEVNVKKNIKATKDIFKIKYPYNESFWKEQNQLLLTNEMITFIEKMGTKNKEFKIQSNIK